MGWLEASPARSLYFWEHLVRVVALDDCCILFVDADHPSLRRLFYGVHRYLNHLLILYT